MKFTYESVIVNFNCILISGKRIPLSLKRKIKEYMDVPKKKKKAHKKQKDTAIEQIGTTI